MKKFLALLLAFCLFCGCGQTEAPPQPVKETWTEECTGIVTDVFTEGCGTDIAHCITVDSGFGVVLEKVFTLTDNSEIMGKTEINIGDEVSLFYESDHVSDYHPIISMTVFPRPGKHKPTNSTYDKPLPLRLVGESTEAEALLGTYEWEVAIGCGHETESIVVCCAHPLDSLESMELLTMGKTVELQFEVPPDELSVSYWKVDLGSPFRGEGNYHDICNFVAELDDNKITLEDCACVYEVHAKWDIDVQENPLRNRPWGGSALYSFYAVSGE